jgi:hypothetical protein
LIGFYNQDEKFDKIEKNEMDWACGTYGGRERSAHDFGREN